MSACFWLWLIWLAVLLNGFWGVEWPWVSSRPRVVAHLIFMLILAYLIYRVCGTLSGNLVH